MQKEMFPILLLLLFGIFSCSNDSEEVVVEEPEPDSDQNSLYFPPVDSEEWKTLSIEDLSWNPTAETELYNFLEEKNTKAFIILKDGKIVIEKYFNGSNVSDNNPWYSAGKTLMSFMIGIAQQEELLDINQPSNTYLGTQWADITINQENAITVKNHLSMTTGLDYNVANQNCTDFECLTYLNTPNSFWYYHNGAYTLLSDIITGATGMEYTDYFDVKIKNKIGMNGAWLSLGYANVYYSTARSMARFGLLNLNKGSWDDTPILTHQNYFTEMTTSSQNLNPAYGYLWWINGKTSFRAPSFETEFQGELMPDAPDDLIAGLGKDDQKLYIVPSQNLVIVRMGEDTGEALLGPSSFDNDLWIKMNELMN